MKIRAIKHLVIVLTVIATTTACQRASSEYVTITNISPNPSTTLHVGDTVNLEVTANYDLTTDSGDITLVVQAGNNSVISNNTEVVTKGSGTVTIKSSFVVPETNSLLVFMPLSAQGQSSTTTVDHRVFKVAPK